MVGMDAYERKALLSRTPLSPSPRLLCLLGVLALVAGAWVGAGPAKRELRRAWLANRAPELWRQAILTQTDATPGEPVLWIRSHQAGLDTLVLQDATAAHLRDFPCLSTRGGSPGKNSGPLLIQAHRDTHFAGLGNLRAGDRVTLEQRDGALLEYTAKDLEIISAEQLETRFDGVGDPNLLVLITCFPFSYTGPAPYRYMVLLERDEAPEEPHWESLLRQNGVAGTQGAL